MDLELVVFAIEEAHGNMVFPDRAMLLSLAHLLAVDSNWRHLTTKKNRMNDSKVVKELKSHYHNGTKYKPKPASLQKIKHQIRWMVINVRKIHKSIMKVLVAIMNNVFAKVNTYYKPIWPRVLIGYTSQNGSTFDRDSGREVTKVRNHQLTLLEVMKLKKKYAIRKQALDQEYENELSSLMEDLEMEDY